MIQRTLVLFMLACLGVTGGASGAATLDGGLGAALEALGPGERLPVVVSFHGRVDLGRFRGGRATAGPMIRALRENAAASQARVLEHLARRGMGERAVSLWVNNRLALEADRALVLELARFDEVRAIEPDRRVALSPPLTNGRGGHDTWHIPMVRADEVWNRYGLDGAGIVIGYMDSGFNPDHPALVGKWRGGDNSWFDAVNYQPDPYDDHGHGTLVCGVLVGGDGPGPFEPDTGLAYGATFIAAKGLDYDTFVLSDMEECGQWMLDPDGDPGTDDFPHVVSNSWGAGQTWTDFYPIAEAWRAVGIIPVFANGNDGPEPGTTLAPANYDITIGVGASTRDDEIWVSSSRGPTPDGWAWPADGIAPDLVAPGHEIYSTSAGGGYSSNSGSSYATPHVAATAALMLQADPGLGYEEIRAVLLATAIEKGEPGRDNTWGSGRLDSYAAVSLVAGTSIVTGPGAGPGNPTLVRLFDSATPSSRLAEWTAYGVNAFGVNVACGDLDGDGRAEVLTGAGPGPMFGPHVRGFDKSGAPLPGLSFLAYGTPRWGVNVAAGDLDADGFDEIITGAGPGAVFGPHVRGWNWDGSGSPAPIPGLSWFAYGTPKWGVNVACGDLDGDGRHEVVTGAGPGAVYGPHVRGWARDGGGAAQAIPGISFFAYSTLKFGVNVACGDLDGDGMDEILTGAGPGAVFGSHVRGWNWDGSATVQPLPSLSFFAFPDCPNWGVNVGSGDLDGDGFDEILAGPGPGEAWAASVRAFDFDGAAVAAIDGIDFLAYDEGQALHGVKVAAE